MQYDKHIREVSVLSSSGQEFPRKFPQKKQAATLTSIPDANGNVYTTHSPSHICHHVKQGCFACNVTGELEVGTGTIWLQAQTDDQVPAARSSIDVHYTYHIHMYTQVESTVCVVGATR